MRKKRTRSLQSAKYLEKKKKKKVLKYSLIFVGIIAVFSLLVVILNTSPFQISDININGAKTLSVDSIKEDIRKSMEGKYFGVLSRTNFIFYPKKDIESIVKGKYKKIQNMDIETFDMHTINITITESLPNAIACEGFREEESQDKCYFVDERGFVFEKAGEFSEGVYTKYYSNHNSNPLEVGINFMDPNRFMDLQKFVKAIKNDDVRVLGILLSDDGSYEMYVRNFDDSITVVYFDDRTPFDKTASNFLAFWQSALDNKLGTSSQQVFDYINLRFGNNVFYTTR